MNKIKFYRGDSVTLNLTFTDVDLTDGTIFFTAKSAVDDDATDSSAVITATVTSHTDPTAGETQITLPATDTTTITPGEYLYDIQLLSGTSVSTVAVGKMIVQGDITRRIS